MAERKGTVTDRERVEALLRRQKPDRVPSWPLSLGFATVYTGTSVADAYNNPQVSLAAQRKASQDFGWVFWPQTLSPTVAGWEFGGEIKWPSGEFAQAPMMTRFPVATEEDARNLKMPDVKTAGFAPIAMEFFKLSSQERLDNEPFNVMSLVGGAFTASANITGPEMFSKWLLKKSEVAHHLLRMGTDYLLQYARLWKDTFGIDGVLPMLAEPTAANQIISPAQFEQFVLPYNREISDNVLAMGYKHIFVHICGEQNLNLPHWAKMKFGDPGIISTPHEVDLKKMAEYFPNDIIFGNIEPKIIQVEKPDVVYEETRKVVEKGKSLSNGFIFSTGCEMPPLSPVENVKAMQQAVADYGCYE